MTAERWPLRYLLPFISLLAILSFQHAEAKGRSTAKIHTNLVNSVCTQKDEFEKTEVLQEPIKWRKDFNGGPIKCGWFRLQPCQEGSSPSCTKSNKHFLPCKKGLGQLKVGRGINVKEPSNVKAGQGQDEDLKLIAPGLGLPTGGWESERHFSYIKKRPKGFGRNGNLKAKKLPRTVTPQHYDIFLRPVITEGAKWPVYTAPGNVTILLDVKKSTNKILLHRGKDMEIVSAKLTKKSDNKEVKITGQSFEKEQEIHTLKLASSLTSGVGQYELFIAYNATISQLSEVGQPQGIFALPFYEDGGKPIAMTQLEWDWARRAFPAFDEPHFKANFTLSIARTADFNVLSNSPLAKTEKDPENTGWFIDSFKPTLKMSPYLVAFVVSDFKCIVADPLIYPSKPVQICGAAKYLADKDYDFAVNTSAHAMKLLESSFKFPYEHSKVDGIGAPGYRGGMENWGLILYGADNIVYKKRISEEDERFGVIKLVVHELVHNWIGNLVTCKSWENYWLNEGINTYFTDTFIPQLYPEISPSYLRMGLVQGTLQVDIGWTSAVSGPTATEDRLVYEKGGAIMSMVEAFMGKELLLEAFAEYLKRFAYKAVQQNDLFQVLDEFAQRKCRISTGQSLKEILGPWVLQPNHPLVRVERHPTNPTLFKVTQEVFQKKGGPVDSKLWVIPIYIASHKNPSINGRIADLWFSTPSMKTKLYNDPNSWYIFNADGVGFYHVHYSDELLDLILKQLAKANTAITPASRAALIFDYFLLHQQGHVKLETALSLTKFLINESDQDVWHALFKALASSTISTALVTQSNFRAYWTPRIKKLLDTYPVKNLEDSGSIMMFKSTLFQWSNSMVLPDFTAKASAIVEEWKKSGKPVSSVPPDYWNQIYCGAVADKTASQFEFLLDVYQTKTEKIEEGEVFAIFGALTCSQDPQVLQKLFNATLDQSLLKKLDDAVFFFRALTQNAVARGPLLKFLKDRFADLIKVEKGVRVASLADIFARSCYSEAERDELLTILEQHQAEIENAERLINGVKTSTKRNLDFMSTTGNAALKWFAENK